VAAPARSPGGKGPSQRAPVSRYLGSEAEISPTGGFTSHIHPDIRRVGANSFDYLVKDHLSSNRLTLNGALWTLPIWSD
jgi:hypothetical protein